MKKTTKKFNMIAAVIVCTVIVLLIWGSIQNNSFAADLNLLKDAENSLENRTDYAISTLEQLNQKYPDNFYIYQVLGEAFAIRGDFQMSSLYMQKAIDEQSLLSLNPIFMLKIGQIYLFNGDKEKTKVYIEQAKKIGVQEEYLPLLEDLLAKARAK